MPQIHSFPPIENASARILILGSMPGKESLRAGQYYAHPRNAFWPIMGELTGTAPDLPYAARIEALKSAGIALWDVLATCARHSSLDADIEAGSICPNDFVSFFLRHPGITRVFFNGGMAEKCFRIQVQPLLEHRPLHYLRLPSTSPAHASMSYGQKLQAWQAAILAGRDGLVTKPGYFTGSRDDGEAICEQICASRAKPIAVAIGAKRGRKDAANWPPAPAKAGGTK